MRSRNKVALVLFTIVLLAGGLRLYGLQIQSLWVDELASVRYSDPDDLRQVVRLTRSDVHPPGYYLLLSLTRSVLGDEEWALRFPSAVAGVLSVLAMYFLGRRLYSEREGLATALFTAVLFAPLYYSQEARSYSLLLLFSVLTAYFWWGTMTSLRAGKRTPPWEAAGYVGSAIVCCYLHYFGLFLILLQGICLLLLTPRTVRSVVLLYMPVAVAYLPWLPVLREQARDKPVGAPSFIQYLDFLFNHSTVLQFLVCTLFALSLPRVLADLRRSRDERSLDSLLPGGLLLAWFLGPFVVAYLVAEFYVPVLTPRNLIISLPAAYLLLARAISRVLAGDRMRYVVVIGLAGLFLGHLLFSMDYYAKPRKEQVRETVRFVTKNERPGTLVVHCGVGREANYYYKKQGSDMSKMGQVGACKTEDLRSIRQEVRNGDYRYLIFVHAHLKPEQELLDALGREFDMVRHENLSKAGAYLYEIEVVPCEADRVCGGRGTPRPPR